MLTFVWNLKEAEKKTESENCERIEKNRDAGIILEEC